MTSFIQVRWKELMNNLKVDTFLDKWFNIVRNHYSEPWRYYHTIKHIEELLLYFDSYREKLKRPELCALSIWFHDVIYDPKRNDNEEESVRLFREFATETNQASDMIEKVTQYILCTKSHKLDEEYDADLSYFLDFDLAVLGKPRDEYITYSSNIRKEYIHFPEESYKKGRSSVLRNLLSSEYLFSTQDFRQLYESTARENLKNEIRILDS